MLRPPHADELALVGTIRTSNNGVAFENLGFHRERDDEISPSIPTPNWIELQPRMISSNSFPTTDYEVNSNDYLAPQSLLSTMNENQPYESDDQLSHFRFQTLRRPELMLPQVLRLDTSTESPGVQYSSIVPKSILKGSTNPTPTSDLRSMPRSRTPSRTSVRIIDRPMQFANVNRLNEIQWQIPREFPDTPPEPSTRHVSRIFVPWKRHFDPIEPLDTFFQDHPQALEY